MAALSPPVWFLVAVCGGEEATVSRCLFARFGVAGPAGRVFSPGRESSRAVGGALPCGELVRAEAALSKFAEFTNSC